MKDLIEITLDFETYYCKKSKYSLAAKGMTIEKYIRNPKFEIIGLAVKVGNKPTEWLCPHEIEDWIKHIEIAYGWDNVRVIAHNARFDAAILGWKYNIYPKQIADTMLMSRACQLWDGHSLDNVTRNLRDRYNWGIVRDDNGQTMWGKFEMKDLPDTLNKGDEVVNADGKQLFDFTEAEYDAYADYCITDVDLTWSAYNWFMKVREFPEKEIEIMTLTIEMFTYPVIELHKPVLLEVEKTVNGKRQALLDKVGATVEDLRSDAKFAELLRQLGVEPPTKLNPKGEVKYAFAKKDLGFLKLLEHEDQSVVELVEARLGNKSSQAVTRVKTLLEMSDRGLLPIPLEYYAAHTGRWGGCLVADTLVLVKNEKEKFIAWKPIVTVSPRELVFDGKEFVAHDGVQYRGDAIVMSYNGIVGTPNHLVLCNNDGYYSIKNLIELGEAGTSGIAYAPMPPSGEGYVYHGKLFDLDNSYDPIESVYDIVNCGPNHRFAVLTRSGIAIVHNSDGINLQNFNRNQLVDKSTPTGTKVFYADKADAVAKVLDDGKVQLVRAGVVDNDEELLHTMGLRDALKAPKGKKLVVFDLSQVELRANAWEWGEQWVLDTLVQGKDIYKVTASSTYGIPYEEVNKSQRFVGKSQQLGLGYGAGVNGLKVVMGKRSEEFTDDELQSFVNAYRNAASNIVRGWRQCKAALEAMTKGATITFCKDDILSTDGHRIALPNGLHLTYRDIHARPGEIGPEYWFWGKNKQTKKPDWEKTFSGKVDENITQSLCRIIMGDIMIAIREDFAKRNWSRDDAHICLTVHDEVIVCCKDELAEEVSEIMQYQMKKSRDWYHDLPLDCAGDIAQRYGCAK
nr:MAG TPA: DNA polymerase I [Caudoviricetes sp.]